MTHNGSIVIDKVGITFDIVFPSYFKNDKYNIVVSNQNGEYDANCYNIIKTARGFSFTLLPTTLLFFPVTLKWIAGYGDVEVEMFLTPKDFDCHIKFKMGKEEIYYLGPPDRQTAEVEFSRWVKRMNREMKSAQFKPHDSFIAMYSREDARDYYKALLNQHWVKIEK
jgi:hypothetical protein